jgi:hypothetical protein
MKRKRYWIINGLDPDEPAPKFREIRVMTPTQLQELRDLRLLEDAAKTPREWDDSGEKIGATLHIRRPMRYKEKK